MLKFTASLIVRIARRRILEEGKMEGSVYKIIEIVGTSANSWEDAAKVAVETAGATLEDLRVAEVVKQDLTIENGRVTGYRIRLTISFKYHPGQT
jgi:flavin-binding protein dodecin